MSVFLKRNWRLRLDFSMMSMSVIVIDRNQVVIDLGDRRVSLYS